MASNGTNLFFYAAPSFDLGMIDVDYLGTQLPIAPPRSPIALIILFAPVNDIGIAYDAIAVTVPEPDGAIGSMLLFAALLGRTLDRRRAARS